MTIALLHPDAPQLSVELWSPAPEEETFAAACEAVEQAGAQATGVLMSAPHGAVFDAVQRLRDQGLPGPQPVGARFADIVAGRDPELRAARAGFLADDQLLVVEYSPAPPPELHPVAITMYSRMLGTPQDLWLDDERAQAPAFVSWVGAIFQDAVARSGALYGSIEVEASLPSPTRLTQGARLGSPLYISTTMSDADPALLPDLRELRAQDEETAWPTGHLFSGWGPFRRHGETIWAEADVDEATGRRVGQAVQAATG